MHVGAQVKRLQDKSLLFCVAIRALDIQVQALLQARSFCEFQH